MLTDEFVFIGRKWGCIVMPTINIVNLFNFMVLGVSCVILFLNIFFTHFVLYNNKVLNMVRFMASF